MKCLFSGVKQGVWAEEASMVFRNHVEKKPLVAQVESVEEGEWPWERKISVYLVDTTLEDNDIWIHNIMVEFLDEINRAAWDCHNFPFLEPCWNWAWRNLRALTLDVFGGSFYSRMVKNCFSYHSECHGKGLPVFAVMINNTINNMPFPKLTR